MARRQAILYNDPNLLRSASISATAPKPSVNTVKPIPTSRNGSGKVKLLSNPGYTGTDDAQIDVRISTGGSTPRVSSPIYTGAGNGTMTDLAVDSAINEQTITCTLTSLGTDSEYADAPFFHGVLKARTIGASGNNITVSVDAANTGGSIGAITKTATAFSVLADIPSGLQRLVVDGRQNAEFNYGGLALISGGRLDPSTPRLQFGTFPKIYRQYQRQEQGDTVFYLDDETTRTIPAGTVVYNVTGGYRVVVSDGTTTENYTDIVTIFDLLSQLLASQLVEFDGVVVDDRTPDGMASAEMDLRTASIALNPIPEYIDDARTPAVLSAVTAPTAAPTQTVVIECTDNATLGAEKWSVYGTNSNSLGTATTGNPFTSSALNFTIPAKLPTDSTGESNSQPIGGDVDVDQSGTRFAADTGSASTFPTACIREYGLGPNAEPMDITFEYRLRPDAACDCENVDIPERLNPACIGADVITVNLGGDVLSTIPANIQTRMTTLWGWYEGKITALTAIYTDTGSSKNVENTQYANNHALFTQLLNVFQQALYDLQDASAGLTAYDAVFTALGTDTGLALVDSTNSDPEAAAEALNTSGEFFPTKYLQKLNKVRVDAGLQPNPSSAGVNGTDCWQDYGDTHWWVPTSGRSGLLPMFTNKPYILAVERRDEAGNIKYESLRIAGFKVAIGCAGSLQVGDTITVSILPEAGAGAIKDNRFYQIGDKYHVDVIFGADIALQGGISGDNTHTWAVAGSDLGALENYAVVHGSEALYDNNGGNQVQFKIFRGGRDANLGEKITFNVQKARYEWRKDGGSWSTITDLPAAATTLTDGLDIQFEPGVKAPNWGDQDIYSFDVIARFKPTHMQAPGHGTYQFEGAAATITFDLGSDQSMDIVAFPVLNLPTGADVTVRGLNAADTVLWTHTMTARDGMLIDWFEPANTARKLQISLVSATAAKIGWVFAGSPVMPTYACIHSFISPAFLMGGDADTAQLFFGAGNNGEFEWDRSLSWTDLQALYDLVTYVKRHNNQPVVAISDPDELDIVAMMRIDSNRLQVAHVDDHRKFDRVITDLKGKGASMTLPFAPVYQP